MKKLLATAILGGLVALSCVTAFADDDQAPASATPPPAVNAPAPAAAAAAKAKLMDGWWNKSAADFDPIVSKWLFHMDGTLSYMNASGNTSGTSFDVSGNGEIRKYRFTSHTFAQLSRRELNYLTTRSSVDYTERTLREQVDYDLTSRVTLLAGIEDYKNTLMFMNKRLNIYGGMGATLFENKKHRLTLTGGAGHASFDFSRTQLLSVNPTLTSLNTTPDSGGVIGMQTWRWIVSPRFSFNEDASYMQYFETDLGHRWTINASGNVPISKYFSFNISYRLKEETNSIIKALRVLPEDRTFQFGLKVSI